MKCNHCLISILPIRKDILLGSDVDGDWYIMILECPSCNKFNLILIDGDHRDTHSGIEIINTLSSSLVRPRGSNRPPCPREVSPGLAEDYLEACLVLPDSPKASAALTRRCLQNLLREKAGISDGNLSNEIQQVIDSNSLPSQLSDMIDAVRNIGNFAAHPMKSNSTGEILPVEKEEAEWNLDVLEALFDFYYVAPEKIRLKIEKLNSKLADAGKPDMK